MWQMTPYIYPLVISGLIILMPLRHIIRKKRRFPGRNHFCVLLLAISVWSLCYACELASPGLSGKIFWSQMKYTGIVTIPVAWLGFVLAYSGYTQWLTRRLVSMLSIIPVLTLILAWTNPLHGLFYSHVWLVNSGSFTMKASTHGPAYWGLFAYSYVLLIIGMLLIIRTFLHAPPLYRTQTTIILIAAVLPVIGNLMYNIGLNPLPYLDLSPLTFAMTGLLVSWAIIRYQLFDIIPIAHDVIIEHMEDGVIVQDAESRILSINPAGRRILGCQNSEVIGKTLQGLLADGLPQIKQYMDSSAASNEIELAVEGTPQHYDLRISPLYDRQQHLIGRIVTLHNITDRKAIEGMLRQSEERYKTLSVTDSLTKLYNVRHFYSQLDAEMSLSRRSDSPLSLLLFDIDDFKQFNDTWGHVEGDKVLAALGEFLRLNLRKTDTAYRYGGEEFTVTLPSTTGQNSMVLAEKIRTGFAAHPFRLPGEQEVHLSVSIGIAQLRKQDTQRSFVQRADNNMYTAKRDGKNRVVYTYDDRE